MNDGAGRGRRWRGLLGSGEPRTEVPRPGGRIPGLPRPAEPGAPRAGLPWRARAGGAQPPRKGAGVDDPSGSPLRAGRTDGAPAPDPLATAAEEQRLRATFLRLRAAVDALVAAANAARTAATQAFHAAERRAARQTHRALTQADAEAAEAYDAIRSVLLGRAGRLAPGPAAAPWDAAEWRSADWLATEAVRYLRIGSLVVPGVAPDGERLEDLPALVPLLDVGNLAVVDAEDAGWSVDVLSALVLRALATAPAGRLEVVVFDPRIRGVFSPFSTLRRASADIFGEPIATPADFARRLHTLRAAVARVAELVGAHGVPDLGGLIAATGVQPEPYRLVVVLDYPSGVDSVVQEELIRLADGGPRRGVSLLVQHDPRVPGGHGVDPAALLAHATVVAGRAGALTIDAFPGVTIRPDPAPPRELVTAVATHLADRAHHGAAPSVDFADLLPARDRFWSRTAIDGMTAVLGTSGFDRVELELRGADPALPNVLIGGASGQGKSNLLLVMLHSIAASYSPDEVEMYLLDYKDGLEFDRLGPRADRPHWMPHVRVLGLEGDRLFGLAVLRHVEAEFRRRAERFRLAGQNHIGAYRRAHPGERMPRILVVIDEFQVLITADDDLTREAVGILETLARRGRAVGIHLVLASQTLSGISALATKERSIFGQFPWRVSLKTEASESEAVLGRANTEAAQLRFRGEAILNREYGSPDHNRRAMIAYADERLLDQVRAEWWVRSGDPAPPRVFYASRASDPAELPAALARVLKEAGLHHHGGRQALLGLPVDVDPHPVSFALRPDPGRTLAVIGDGRDEALGALTAAAWSLAAQDPAGGAEFVFLDALAGAGAPTPEVVTMAGLARSRGHTVTVHAGRDVGQALIDLGDRLDERLAEAADGTGGESGEGGGEPRPLYVIAPGMHRAPRLEQYTGSGARPYDALQRLVGEGPIAQLYFLGWWSTLNVFHLQLRYEMSALVGGYLFLRLPESDVQSVCGPYVRYSAQPHRALFWDRTLGMAPATMVPFAVPPAIDLRRLGGTR
jgi:hypothetical protein